MQRAVADLQPLMDRGLAVTTKDGPAVHVWDLRSIRRHLHAPWAWTGMRLRIPTMAKPTLEAPPLPPLQVDLGPLAEGSSTSTGNPNH